MGHVDDVGAALDALGATPTGDQARAVTGDYDPADTLAAVYEKVKAGGGGSLPVIEATAVLFTSARIKTLFTTPGEVVPAPGAGKALFLVGHFCQLKFVAPAYTIAGSGQPNFGYAGNEANSFNTLADLTITAAANHCDADWGGIFGSVFNDQVIVENKAINFFVTNANPAAGNGSLIVNTYYITVDLA